MQTNTLAFAKVVVNKRLNMLRLIATFDTVSGRVTVLNAAFKSGDLCDKDADEETVQHEVMKALRRARHEMRTDNILVIQ